MGLPGFYGRFLEVRKAKSAKKKRGLVRENRRFDPLGLSPNSGGPTKKISGGEGCLVFRYLKKKLLADFDDVRLKRCVKSIRRSDQLLEFGR